MEKKSLGRINKPSLEGFRKTKKKLYLVALIYPGGELERDAGRKYKKKMDQYWGEVQSRIQDLEAKLGKVSRMYHEMVYRGGKEGLKDLKKFSQSTHAIVKSYLDRGASFEITEEENLIKQSMDWARCLATNPQSSEVLARLMEFYVQSMRKRDKAVTKKIEATLGEGEAGLVFLREGTGIDLSSDTEVFRILPPILDDIHRFLENLYASSGTKAKKN